MLEARKETTPDYRGCDEALTRVVGEVAARPGATVALGPAKRRLRVVFVPGFGWSCFTKWLEVEDTIPDHLRQFGYDMVTLAIDGLGSSEFNAEEIARAILSMPQGDSDADLVLVGYSKGVPDMLTALVRHPEIHPRLAAVVSIGGVVGGSPLANDATDDLVNLMQYVPGATCAPAGGSALEDLRPDTRKAWLARHPLPPDIPYYSLVTFPDPTQISSILRGSYDKLARIDARNDGQILFYDQFIPDSTLVAYLNADHWAVAVPVARKHGVVSRLLVNQNAYPREALYEALLRFLEEDLATRSR